MSALGKFNLDQADKATVMRFSEAVHELVEELREVPQFRRMPINTFFEIVQVALASHCACLSMARVVPYEFKPRQAFLHFQTKQCMGAIDSTVRRNLELVGMELEEA